MRRSQQAFSVPSKQTQSSNAKDELSSTASINASSTTLIPSSKLLASKPRDCTLKREQKSCYEHDNGLTISTVVARTSKLISNPKRARAVRCSNYAEIANIQASTSPMKRALLGVLSLFGCGGK